VLGGGGGEKDAGGLARGVHSTRVVATTCYGVNHALFRCVFRVRVVGIEFC
jgi:hypothetical protein